MPELRWILIVIGALLLVGIYLWGRRSSRQAGSEDTMLRIPEPVREPQTAYVLREEPADFAGSPDDGPGDPDIGDEYINANRRYRDVAVDESEAAVEEVRYQEPPLPTRARDRDGDPRRARIEPTLSDDDDTQDVNPHAATYPAGVDRPIVDRPAAHPPAHVPGAAQAVEPVSPPAAPTLSMSSSPPPRRTERRKIIALRIAAGSERFTGAQLLDALLGDGLQHGKYDVFHRLSDAGASIFSIASMVEPGTFDPSRMNEETYPGITLFAQLPGPVDSLLAFNELVLSARRLQEKLGGTLQDERGVPLTIHRVERLRQDVRDFEQGQARDGRRIDTATPTS